MAPVDSISQVELSPLLRLVAATPASAVYRRASREAIFRGFKIYQDMAVSAIEGARRDGDPIIVHIGGAEDSHDVKMTMEDSDSFSLTCSCGENSPPDHCHHIVCALMTVMNLLKPGVFRMNRENTAHRTTLLKGLFPTRGGFDTMSDGGSLDRSMHDDAITQGHVGTLREDGVLPHFPRRAVMTYRIIAEIRNEGYGWHIEKNGLRLPDENILRHDLPHELKNLVYRERFLEGAQDALMWFFRFFSKAEYPVLLRVGDELFPLVWNESLPHKTWTSIDVKDGAVYVSKEVSLGDDPSPGIIMGRMATGSRGGVICPVEKKEGWAFWEIIREADRRLGEKGERISNRRAGATFVISQERFRNVPVSVRKTEMERFLKDCRFFVEGVAASPVLPGYPHYKISVESAAAEDACILRGECIIGEDSFDPMNLPFSLIDALENRDMPKSVRRPGARERLLGILFRAMSKRTAAEVTELLNDELNAARSGRPNIVRLERSIIRKTLSVINEQAFRFFLTDEGWTFAAVDRQREIALHSILFELYGPKIFSHDRHKEGIVIIGRKEFATNFSLFDEAMRHCGIEVSFNGLPLVVVTWDFGLDATESAIDWFELKPEVACNGKTIERDVWETALKSKGVLVRNGVMEILDAASLKKLVRLADVARPHARGRREVVSLPRLRIIDLMLLRREGISVRFSSDDEEIVKRLADLRGIGEKSLPQGFKGVLRAYQKEGYWWISFLYEHRFGACLADDMGLGKTLQAIIFLGALKEGILGGKKPSRPSLVVVPPSLIFNWEQEMARFYPGLRVLVYRGGGRSADFAGYDVILTSYGLVRRDIGKLETRPFEVIIFDEAQAIKNILADTTASVRRLKGRFKVALTGTPVENHLGEYFSIIDLVLPGLLGDYKEFLHQAKHEASRLIIRVAEQTRPFVLRRTKEHILKELPPRVEHDVYLELTQKQKAFYNRTVEEVKASVEQAYRDKSSGQANIIALTAIMKLRQICLTPQLIVPEMEEVSPKIEFLTEKIEELISELHSALVFSQFTSFLDIVEASITRSGYPFLRLDGSTPVTKRKDVVETFQESRTPTVFLLSLKAGGQGLNLTRASYVFHLDPWWNPAVENQASDRAHRLGQTRSVMITRLLMRHTVEEKMMELKKRKTALYRALLQSPESSPSSAITKDDFDFLLSG